MKLRLILIFLLAAAQQLVPQESRNYIKFESNSILGTVYLFEEQDNVYYYRPVEDFDSIQPSPYIQGKDTFSIYPLNKAIRLSKSKAANSTFCIDSNAIYACWFSGKDLLFQRSIDGGRTFLPEAKVLVSTKLGSDYVVDSVPLKNTPVLLCDLTQDFETDNGLVTTLFKHRIYVCWTDAKYSFENKDVFLMYSDDRGESWTEPVLVSYYPNHKAQFDVKLALDDKGVLYLHYYDKKNYAEGKLTDLTLARSKNGGLKFDYYTINDAPFRLTRNNTHNVTYGLELYAYGSDSDNGYNFTFELSKDSVYAAYDTEFATKQNFLRMPKTISFSKKITLPIELEGAAAITAVVTKPLDPYFEKRVFTEKKFAKGKNNLVLNTKHLGLKKGNYTFFLYYNFNTKFAWIVTE